MIFLKNSSTFSKKGTILIELYLFGNMIHGCWLMLVIIISSIDFLGRQVVCSKCFNYYYFLCFPNARCIFRTGSFSKNIYIFRTGCSEFGFGDGRFSNLYSLYTLKTTFTYHILKNTNLLV